MQCVLNALYSWQFWNRRSLTVKLYTQNRKLNHIFPIYEVERHPVLFYYVMERQAYHRHEALKLLNDMQKYNSHQKEVWEACEEGGRGHTWIREVKIWKAVHLLSTIYPVHGKRKGIVGKKYGQILTDACLSKKTVLEETSSDKTRMCSKTFCQAYAKMC